MCPESYWVYLYFESSKKDEPSPVANQVHDQTVRKLVSSEELILQLTPEFKRLTKGILNLQLPDDPARKLFNSTVQRVDITDFEIPTHDAGQLISSFHWTIDSAQSGDSTADSNLWKPFLRSVQ